MMRRTFLVAVIAALLGLAVGVVVGRTYPRVHAWFAPDPVSFQWPDGFREVDIVSSVDGVVQKAMFRAAPAGPKQPLLVSLHVWSGSHASPDPLAVPAARAEWNFVRPDYRGPARTPENCLSDKVLADLDDAIDWALREGNVDPHRIFVVGFSGGAYTAIGMYLRSRHAVRKFLAWAPITDLAAWHDQSIARGNVEYAAQVVGCTGGGPALDREAARLRSPLYWDIPNRSRARLEIYAGINDGYTGSVPISHALHIYNRLAVAHGNGSDVVTVDEFVALLSREVPPGADDARIADRRRIFHREGEFGSLTVFQGGHEMLPGFSFDRLREP